MITKNTICECGLNMEYWTKSSFINCTKCGATISVEPCEDEVENIVDVEEDILEVK